MLENTFCHIPGIGQKTERQLWSSGLRTWKAVTGGAPLALSPRKADALKSHIEASIAHLANDNAEYFYDRLAPGEHWRMFREFRHSVAYLDIETTGLGDRDDFITTIALYDGQSIRCYIHDQNLLEFRDDIEPYRLIVTFNGKTFDLPFIRNYLGLPLKQAHIDLRHVLASLGYRGGLKRIERQLGVDRGDLTDIDGYFAVLLWWDYYNRGNQRALETLLAYNIEDVLNLETLMVTAYNLKLGDTPFEESHRLPLTERPERPFNADLETIERIRRE